VCSARFENAAFFGDTPLAMNTHARLIMDKVAFLRWAEGREGHFELKDGVVQMMLGGTQRHAEIISDIEMALKTRLERKSWSVVSSDLAVEIEGDVRYPDVLVKAPGGDPQALSITSPTLVCEVLSSSSIANDMNIKAEEYKSLASLEAYIVAAQDEPRLWIWNRSTDAARAWPKVPLEVHGLDKAVPLPALGVELPMTEIYAALPA
jgi:Uma2 family endonuclease